VSVLSASERISRVEGFGISRVRGFGILGFPEFERISRIGGFGISSVRKDFKSSRFREFELREFDWGSRVGGFESSRRFLSKSFQALGFQKPPSLEILSNSRNPEIPQPPNTEIPKSRNLQVSKSPNLEIPKSRNPETSNPETLWQAKSEAFEWRTCSSTFPK
jgi:hypothetical protein